MALKIGIGLIVIVLVAVAALAAYARLRPLDPAALIENVAAPGYVPPGIDGAAFCAPAGARFSLAPGDLASLERVALAWPRTRRLGGSVADGHIAWVTRSRIMGFPDITTARIVGAGDAARLCVVARLVIGRGDMGANGARLRAWLQQVGGLNEAPDLVWQPPR